MDRHSEYLHVEDQRCIQFIDTNAKDKSCYYSQQLFVSWNVKYPRKCRQHNSTPAWRRASHKDVDHLLHNIKCDLQLISWNMLFEVLFSCRYIAVSNLTLLKNWSKPQSLICTNCRNVSLSEVLVSTSGVDTLLTMAHTPIKDGQLGYDTPCNSSQLPAAVLEDSWFPWNDVCFAVSLAAHD